MKKFFVILVLALAAVTVSAQPRAIGIRGAWGAQLSYEHEMGGSNFLEAEVGLYGNNALHVEGIYNYIFAGGSTGIGDWNAYWGWGATAGLGVNKASFLSVAAAGQIGIEMNFNIPIQISLDLRPQLGLYLNGNEDAYSGLFFGWYPAIGLRYKF